jgi:hypothetical protein
VPIENRLLTKSPNARRFLVIAFIVAIIALAAWAVKYIARGTSGGENLPAPGDAQERSLTYWALAQRFKDNKHVGEAFRLFGNELTFGKDDDMQIVVTSSDDGHLYILSEEKNGSATMYNLLFPTPKANDASSRIQADREAATGWNYFEGAGRTEKVWIIWSVSPIVELEREIPNLNDPNYRGEIKDAATTGFLRELLETYPQTSLQILPDEAKRLTIVKGKGDILIRLLTLMQR